MNDTTDNVTTVDFGKAKPIGQTNSLYLKKRMQDGAYLYFIVYTNAEGKDSVPFSSADIEPCKMMFQIYEAAIERDDPILTGNTMSLMIACARHANRIATRFQKRAVVNAEDKNSQASAVAIISMISAHCEAMGIGHILMQFLAKDRGQ